MPHAGIDAEDPRNFGIIEYLRPQPVTLESLARKLTAASKGKTAAAVRERAEQILNSIETRPHRPNPPLSQPVDRAPHPWFGLGTHPDLVGALWKLDELLPERCRWLLWGYPALVHPRSGVVFAAAFGTIGLFLRLPPKVVGSAVAEASRTAPADFSSAASDWHLVKSQPTVFDLGPGAYNCAE